MTGNELKSRMTTIGISQGRMAQLCKVHRFTIANWTNKADNPINPDAVENIRKALSFEIDFKILELDQKSEFVAAKKKWYHGMKADIMGGK